MDDKERQELIETIKTRVEVWENKEYHFVEDSPKVELKTGNKYFVDRVTIKDEKLRLTAYDDPMYSRQLSLEQLTDDSLEILSLALPMTNTIFVTAHTENSEQSFVVVSVPVPCTFDSGDMLQDWLEENFPALKWEGDDMYSLVCYTEFNNHTGPYLLAELILSE